MAETRPKDILGLARAALLALVLSVGASAAMFSGFAGFSSFAGANSIAGAAEFVSGLQVEGVEAIGLDATAPILQLMPRLETIIPTECFARSGQEPPRRSF
ncbi:MAG TPA: hypothetical protein VJQ56_11270 [Blastocatellia bacterium]|nr:hypothetical protein [Blastocatellia bacterium]